jgi:dolichyl-phosphate beta-glucosyltransferase
MMGGAARCRATVVIPAFNEAARLPRTLGDLAARLAARVLDPLEVRQVLVVDDGSTDATATVAERHGRALPRFGVLRDDANRGKGHAVRRGLAAAGEAWVLTADADLATPWEEGAALARAALARGCDMVIGSRDLPGSVLAVRQSPVRERLGKLFNRFVRRLTGLPFRDTQCGFKLMRRAAVAPLLAGLAVDRFAWDVELLLAARARGLAIVELPVRWEHREGSRVRLWRDGLEMVAAVLQARWRLASRGGEEPCDDPDGR